ncbi:MAG: hypothetical protein PHP97_00500 [Candidatus Shapirobacteria bacterium]|nr:hypothetical protein [Candidatus Shapirobacteria bacterium]MDD3002430.1 hypothetical protein [Candidatus Shapirobacteria bacterium]MDD4383445.1 hypothetical protein [Candidatus Shapirobacteria bacterium]
MNKENISQALTAGLVAGYGGKTEFIKTDRGGFTVKSSHFQNGEVIYHDEWTKGGGQEIVKIGEESFTRVYAGGVADKEVLEKLGITHEEVISNLMNKIQKLGEKTRLFNNCPADLENDWKYEYKILDQDDQILITTGKETIRYKDELVFTHVFVLSPIK